MRAATAVTKIVPLTSASLLSPLSLACKFPEPGQDLLSQELQLWFKKILYISQSDSKAFIRKIDSRVIGEIQ